jgi:hypothetical protein
MFDPIDQERADREVPPPEPPLHASRSARTLQKFGVVEHRSRTGQARATGPA